jgi:2-iminobutanoate/2-iminopropanoate deaminase
MGESGGGGKQRIDTDGEVFGPYSAGVKAGGVIWLAGQIAPEAGDVVRQTKASLDKVDALLAAAGASKHDTTFVQVLLDDIADFQAMNEIYGKWLAGVEIPPARAAFEAAALPRGAKVEIVVQAYHSDCC